MTTTTTPVAPTRLLTLDEVRARTGMGRTFLYALAQAGAIRRARIGRSVRFVEADVEAWVQARIAEGQHTAAGRG
ncbi:helix-turn-helix transcriptional regulator [Castellaniella ginsengisoli]|uniref:helix-turn-helix transcriptional regulator n=1 Tax=Castellaniella ginsengisoli TaxID=546114 RepID=UPI0034CD5AD1